jgi:hypothetical protein
MEAVMNRDTRRWIFDAVVWSIGVAMTVVLGFDAIASERFAPLAAVVAQPTQNPIASSPGTSHGKV